MITPHGSENHPRRQHSNDDHTSRLDGDTSVAGDTSSARSHTVQYFRQPRHSSIREHPPRLKSPFTTSTRSQQSLASSASASTEASSEIPQPSLITTNRPMSSSQSGSSDDDWNDTRSVPLGPRWQDYTYREGDNFYGRAPTTAVKPSVTSDHAGSTKHNSAAALHGTVQIVSGAVSALRSSIVSALHTQPVSTGFEVVRPPRVLGSEDKDES